MRLLVVCLLFSSYCLATVQNSRGLSATLPITTKHFGGPKRALSSISKRQKSSAIGLGDLADLSYSVQINVGSTSVPVILDTGSSDLWAVSTDCSKTSCGFLENLPRIDTSSFHPTGLGVELEYGDSAHATSARGRIVSGPTSVAGLTVEEQFLGAINATDTGITIQGLSGILGAGFPNPSGSAIYSKLVLQTLPPDFTRLDVADAYVSTLQRQGPMFARLVNSGQLEQPMFTITLQRETIDIGGNIGQLTIGTLPEGISNDSLTWVPVRLYTPEQGGIPGPSTHPNERYPIRWEVPIDAVLLNGQRLPLPDLPGGIGYTALVDSGTTFIAGPESLVQAIYQTISVNPFESVFLEAPEIACDDPVELTFVIGGKSFLVDPRDFLGAQQSVAACVADSLVPTDEPQAGGLMSWVLGGVFMKSALVAFYFGNLTHPSVDPPRMGFLSTVPDDYLAQFVSAINTAQTAGTFPMTSVPAPAGTFVPASTNSVGVGQAPTQGIPAAAGGGDSVGSTDNGTPTLNGDKPFKIMQWPFIFVLCLLMHLF